MANNKVKKRLIEYSMNDAVLSARALRSNVKKELIHLKNGVKALDFLFGTGNYADIDLINRPKAILLGLEMTKMDEHKVIRQIKENELKKAIPKLVHSSSKEHPDSEPAYSLNSNSSILNPFRFNGFAKTVSSLGFCWLLMNRPHF